MDALPPLAQPFQQLLRIARATRLVDGMALAEMQQMRQFFDNGWTLPPEIPKPGRHQHLHPPQVFGLIVRAVRAIFDPLQCAVRTRGINVVRWSSIAWPFGSEAL